MRARYDAVANAKQGDKVLCPTCLRGFTKTYYSQRFCGVQKIGSTLIKNHHCKDTYHKAVKAALTLPRP